MKAPNLILPQESILTRWSSWINEAVYFFENFGIKDCVIFMLNRNDGVCIKNAQNYIKKPEIENNLTYINSHWQIYHSYWKIITAKYTIIGFNQSRLLKILKNHLKHNVIQMEKLLKINSIINREKSWSFGNKKKSKVLSGKETFNNLNDLSENLNLTT